MIGYKAIFISGSELDKEKSHILANIDFTKTAYNIKLEEIDVDNTGTITREEVEENEEIFANIPVITKKVALNNLRQTQTSKGYYTYNDAKLTLYNNRLIYISPREINSRNTTYNSQADEYTHGYGAILVSASDIDENGNTVMCDEWFTARIGVGAKFTFGEHFYLGVGGGYCFAGKELIATSDWYGMNWQGFYPAIFLGYTFLNF